MKCVCSNQYIRQRQTSTSAYTCTHTCKEGGTHKETHILQKGHKDTWRKRHAHTEKGTRTEQEILREKRKADTQGERNTHKMIEEIERMNGREMNTERYTQRKKHKQKGDTDIGGKYETQ